MCLVNLVSATGNNISANLNLIGDLVSLVRVVGWWIRENCKFGLILS